MSLYDKASLIFSGKAGAGNNEVAYNIKPVEKLKVDEYIENGGFDTDSVWIKNTDAGQEATISGGKGRLVGNGSKFTNLKQNDVFEADKVYKVSLEAEIRKGELKVQSNGYDGNIGVISKSGKHSFYFTGVSGSPNLVLGRRSTNVEFDIEVDNVSVREVEQKANDFSFVRGSDLTATHEGADGLIKKTRENLLQYSNNFIKWDDDIVDGVADGIVGYKITSGQIGFFSGSSDATLVEKTGSNNNYIFSDINTVSHNGVFTYSIYAKDGGDANSSIHLYIGDSSNKGNLLVNLNTGAILAGTRIHAVVDPITGSSGDTDRWYRVSFTNDANVNDKPRIQVRDNTGGQSTNAKAFIMNAQLEVGMVATPYIDRTDSFSKSTAGIQEGEPRYDYSLNNALPPALLFEPQRRNLVKHSEYLSDYTANNATKTINALTSPEGVNNAATINVTSNSGSIYAQSGSVVESVEPETKYTFSFYVKRGTNTENYLAVRAQNPSPETFISEDVEYTASTTEWKRISHTFTTPAGCTSIRLYPQRYTSGGQGTTHLFGIQLEKGSCVTSYIPTYGIAATREEDIIPQYTVPNPNPDKYTFFVHSHTDRVASDNRGPRLGGGSSNSTLMGHFITASPSLKKQFFFDDNEGNRALSKATFGSFEAGDETKYAFVVDNTALEAKLFIDGVHRETFSLTKRADAELISLGISDGNPDRIKSIIYFPESLEDSDVVSLTT